MFKPFFDKNFKKIDKNIFLVYGDNDYFKFEAKQFIKDTFQDIPINYYENPTFQELETEMGASDLFSDKKMIWIENFSPISSKNKKKVDEVAFLDFVHNLKDTEDIIIFYQNDNIDKRKKIVKEMMNISNVIECAAIDKKEFAKFIEYLISKHNLQIPKNVVDDIAIHFVECDPFLLYKEFEKLTLYKEPITKDNIYNVLTLHSTKKTFDLIEKIVNRNLNQSLDIYEQLLHEKQAEYLIHSFLSGQFTHMLKIKMIKEDNVMLNIASTLAIHPFMANKLETYSRSFSLQQLIDIQKLLLETDIKIKTGLANSVEAVKFLIMFITNIKKEGAFQ